MFRVACHYAGLECNYVVEDNTLEGFYQNLQEHLKRKHGYKETDSPRVDYEKSLSKIKNQWKEVFEESQKNNFSDIVELAEKKMKK
jgi:predicted small metal-binding protein